MQIDEGYTNFMKSQIIIENLKKVYNEDLTEFYELIYGISKCLQEQKDLELFVRFCTKMYNTGYYKSVEDHKVALQKQGLTAKVAFGS
jgi:hypothetical protein